MVVDILQLLVGLDVAYVELRVEAEPLLRRTFLADSLLASEGQIFVEWEEFELVVVL